MSGPIPAPAPTTQAVGIARACPAQTAPRRHDFSAMQLQLIRRTICRQCTDPEFDEFIAVARQSGLDPLRRQIAPLIVDRHDAELRRLVSWATIDGLRIIAARQGDYRPMETPPIIDVDASRADEKRNPLGLQRAEVRPWKYRDGRWFPVVGEAWWDEHAPVRLIDGEQALDPSWFRMGRAMLSKCAEAQALRRGWPDVLSGLYGEEELHALAGVEQGASERLRDLDIVRARGRTAAPDCYWLVLHPDDGLQSIKANEVARRVTQFLEDLSEAADIDAFHARNRRSLALFWEREEAEAWTLKAATEARMRSLAKSAKKKRPSPRPRSRSPEPSPKRTSRRQSKITAPVGETPGLFVPHEGEGGA